MSNVKEVRDYGNNRSHWVVKGPGGMDVEWDADLVEYVPNRIIGWCSVRNATVGNEGTVRFEPVSDGGTRVDIRLSYTPPAGSLGHALASVFGADPKSRMDEDLMRVKTTLETGQPPHDAARPLRAE